MPRKLPWLQSTTAPRAHVASTPKPDARTETKTYRSDSGVSPLPPLPVSVKRRRRADVAESPSVARRHNGADRALSSSPVPAPEEPQRPISPMRKALNKYDLRDDEWMMVEDELLQTAKSFTRHLYLAEYERLKKNLQTRKDVARPVIANAKPSEERKLRMRIEAQRKAQRKALEDVAEETSDESSGDDLDAPVRTTQSQNQQYPSTSRDKPASMPPPRKTPMPKKPSSRPPPATSVPLSPPPKTIDSIFGAKLKARKAQEPEPPPPPHINTPQKRPSRASIFDLLDSTPTPSSSTKPPTSIQKPSQTKHRRNTYIIDDMDDFPTQETRKERFSRRKDVKRDDGGGGGDGVKKKVVGVDEIPTFLF